MKLDATDIADLRPLIAEAVRSTLDQIAAGDAKLGTDRLAYSEPEAAAMLGVPVHTLRDWRRMGRITATRLGRGVVYSRPTLLKFLTEGSEA